VVLRVNQLLLDLDMRRIKALFCLIRRHFELFFRQFSDLLALLELSRHVKHVRLRRQPCPQLPIRQNLININSHLSKRLPDQIILFLFLSLKLLLSFNICEILLKFSLHSLLSFAEICLQSLLHENTASDRVDRLAVHLLDIFHEGAYRDLVGRFDCADVG